MASHVLHLCFAIQVERPGLELGGRRHQEPNDPFGALPERAQRLQVGLARSVGGIDARSGGPTGMTAYNLHLP